MIDLGKFLKLLKCIYFRYNLFYLKSIILNEINCIKLSFYIFYKYLGN